MSRLYMGSPASAAQAAACTDMPVLISYPAYLKWKSIKSWWQSFSHVLLDSGAFSVYNTGVEIDPYAYEDWAQSVPFRDAYASLDSVSGDWRQGIANLQICTQGFPTYHTSDPYEILDDLIYIARERPGRFLGVGLEPPREGREHWVRETLDRIPPDIWVHGFACGLYAYCGRWNSIDSTNWWRDAQKLQSHVNTAHLTPGEALEIVVKRIKRRGRVVYECNQIKLFEPKK